MKKIVLLLGVCLASAASSNAQSIFDYDDNAVNGLSAGIFASLSVNTSAPFIQKGEGYSHTAKGALSTVPAFGAYIQRGLGKRWSIRGSITFGYSSYAYKYGKTFDSLTDNFTPVLSTKYKNYTTVKHGSGFVMPQVDIGYLFGPFKKIYLIEVRGGIGFHAYLAQSKDSITLGEGKVSDPKNRYTYEYHNAEWAEYGQPNMWGTVTGNIYVGLRWHKTMTDFLNRFSLGIQATFPISSATSGYSAVEYKNYAYEVITRERVQLALCTFGVRAAYSFL